MLRLKSKLCLLTMLIFSIMISSVSARGNEWKDKKADFTKVKTILVFAPIMTPTVQDTFAVQKVTDAIDATYMEGYSFPVTTNRTSHFNASVVMLAMLLIA